MSNVFRPGCRSLHATTTGCPGVGNFCACSSIFWNLAVSHSAQASTSLLNRLSAETEGNRKNSKSSSSGFIGCQLRKHGRRSGATGFRYEFNVLSFEFCVLGFGFWVLSGQHSRASALRNTQNPKPKTQNSKPNPVPQHVEVRSAYCSTYCTFYLVTPPLRNYP